ncbi:MAG: (d)CMP kinase [Halobacteria archaeon]
MRVTVSGPPGSGTTTLAKSLSSEFGYEHVSSGDVFREMADERGYSLGEFNERAEEDPEIDREIDLRQKEIGESRDDVLLEGRLSGWMVEDADVKIWLDAPVDTRAARIQEREGGVPEKVVEDVEAREESEAKRYREIHGIDIHDLSVYDLVINTEVWSEEDVLDIASSAVEPLR